MIVYVAGPYSGNIDENIANARKVSIELWERGYAVLCPHLNTAHFEVDCKATYEDYLNGDLKILEKCDAIVMLKGWERSHGAIREFQLAQSAYMRIYIYPDMPPDLKT